MTECFKLLGSTSFIKVKFLTDSINRNCKKFHIICIVQLESLCLDRTKEIYTLSYDKNDEKIRKSHISIIEL